MNKPSIPELPFFYEFSALGMYLGMYFFSMLWVQTYGYCEGFKLTVIADN